MPMRQEMDKMRACAPFAIIWMVMRILSPRPGSVQLFAIVPTYSQLHVPPPALDSGSCKAVLPKKFGFCMTPRDLLPSKE